VALVASGVTGADLSVGNVGLSGLSVGGVGVYAGSNTGIGMFATSNTRTALSVNGPVQFTSAGVSTIKKGSSTVTVTTSAVTTSTLVLATLQQFQTGVHVSAAVPAAGSFTITLNGAATTDLPVAWFFIG